jgi:hypothetical protein
MKKKIKILTQKRKTLLVNINVEIINEKAPVIEASETYLVERTTINHIRKEIKAGSGKSPITTPKLVETPFPPFPLRKMENECPKIERIPPARIRGFEN